MERAAYYYPATKAQKAKGQSGSLELHLIGKGARQVVNGILCDSKKEARAIATDWQAKPWNF